MKIVLQLLLICLLILISIFFYKYYFESDQKINQIKNENLNENQNNLIKNLKYEARFEDNKQYTITAQLSELTYIDNIEIVKMQKVKAKFIDENSLPLVIISDYAKYNNSNYNTEFYDNILIEYKGNTISSENLDLDFIKNIVRIYNNVVYESLSGTAKTDNVKIDLITKKIDIFMNNKKNNVEIISK